MHDDEVGAGSLAGLSGPRYTLGQELGRGANGVVVLAGDQRLGRAVAMKLLGDDRPTRDKDTLRFTHEAQVTGQLSHPAIVPVHDLGALPDGRVYYTMKRIEGRSLADILTARRHGDPDVLARWTTAHFVATLLRVAEALAFAHDRGVVHRDVKPANVMIGEWGEVLLLDWGVARVLGAERANAYAGREPGSGPEPVSTWRSLSDRDPTIDGTVAGTPAYMAPEQARGDVEAIGPWSDVYGVGVILYEFLVGTRPIRGRTVEELLRRVSTDPIAPPSQAAPDRRVPPELEDLVLRCLAKDRSLRPQRGADLAAELEAFLEGSRRQEEAEELARKGLHRSVAYGKAAEATARAEAAAKERAAATPPWAGEPHRAAVWAAEAAYRSLRRTRDDVYDEAIALLQSAVERAPDLPDAREGLAALYLRRMDEAEARGEVSAARHFRTLALRYDDGRLRPLLQGDSALTVRASHASARVTLHALVEEGRALVLDAGRSLGRAPLLEIPLPRGRWLVRVEQDGLPDVHAPVWADRPCPHAIVAAPPSDLLPGFAYVCGGPYVRGGDPEALSAEERAVVDVPAFAIARHPVTQAELAAFLEAGGLAAGHAVWTGPEGYDDDERGRLPALGVPFATAVAYAQWASQEAGVPLRLATHDEWEKAARGVDARVYPWGGPWEPSFCNGVDALPGEPRPEPVGSRPRDVSVYGVADLSGGVHEWVQGDVPHRPDRRFVRGGSWNGHPRAARLCSRLELPATTRSGAVGLRLVQDLG